MELIVDSHYCSHFQSLIFKVFRERGLTFLNEKDDQIIIQKNYILLNLFNRKKGDIFINTIRNYNILNEGKFLQTMCMYVSVCIYNV